MHLGRRGAMQVVLRGLVALFRLLQVRTVISWTETIPDHVVVVARCFVANRRMSSRIGHVLLPSVGSRLCILEIRRQWILSQGRRVHLRVPFCLLMSIVLRHVMYLRITYLGFHRIL